MLRTLATLDVMGSAANLAIKQQCLETGMMGRGIQIQCQQYALVSLTDSYEVALKFGKSKGSLES